MSYQNVLKNKLQEAIGSLEGQSNEIFDLHFCSHNSNLGYCMASGQGVRIFSIDLLPNMQVRKMNKIEDENLVGLSL